jgi:Uma2 family endonuclease
MATQRTTRVLGPGDHGRELSSAEFAEAEFAEPWTFEREGGRLVVVSPEGQRHHEDSRPWRRRLNRYWIEHPEIVEDIIQGAWIRVDDGTDRIGDIGVYLMPARPSEPIPNRVPDLMFEVVSPGREAHERDYVKKRREYYRFGVREYVVIDRPALSIAVFTRGPCAYHRRVLRLGDVYETPLLPGLAIPLDEVF